MSAKELGQAATAAGRALLERYAEWAVMRELADEGVEYPAIPLPEDRMAPARDNAENDIGGFILAIEREAERATEALLAEAREALRALYDSLIPLGVTGQADDMIAFAVTAERVRALLDRLGREGT